MLSASLNKTFLSLFILHRPGDLKLTGFEPSMNRPVTHPLYTNRIIVVEVGSLYDTSLIGISTDVIRSCSLQASKQTKKNA